MRIIGGNSSLVLLLCFVEYYPEKKTECLVFHGHSSHWKVLCFLTDKNASRLSPVLFPSPLSFFKKVSGVPLPSFCAPVTVKRAFN